MIKSTLISYNICYVYIHGILTSYSTGCGDDGDGKPLVEVFKFPLILSESGLPFLGDLSSCKKYEYSK